ncbi:MAG TPA: DegT/DnrJ/EryC1/StrS family aminotransferase [Gaiellaceae bacterium]|jgi:dTDP-4-amino-4,6-dideoxygalactose transaminase|nr:DegT/DnrJ/EryC1/StrS family aminotransferase [Gaiellaceae bacterium]
MSKRIPLVDLHAQYETIAPEIDDALQRVLQAQSFINGKEVAAFEDEFAAASEASNCIGVSNGTTAIELALVALGVGPGDEVITVSHTFFATVGAIVRCGATPVFVDIDPETWTMDPRQVGYALSPKTKAIVPVHLYGHPADIPAIAAAAPGIPIVEDAAQAHLALYHGAAVGTIGAAATFSFYPGKNLGAYGDAGAVITQDPELAGRMKALRDHGRMEGAKYEHDRFGSNWRMDEFQAAVLRVKLPHLRAWTNARQEIALSYETMLADEDLKMQTVAPWAEHVRHLFVVCHPQRDRILAELKEEGIDGGIHYPVPVHLQPALVRSPGMWRRGSGSLDVTEEVTSTCFSLPLYPELSAEDAERISGALRALLPAVV